METFVNTKFRTVNDVKEANKRIGHYFFDKQAMRFFNSKINGTDLLINKKFFITSEQQNANSPRLYTIRVARPDGAVDTVGNFQAYKTRKAAQAAAHKL